MAIASRMTTKAILAVTLAAFLAACTTTDPYTGEQRTSRATQGAVLGAIGGAIIGALTNTSSGSEAATNALIGAGVGALAGGAVGGYMDRQEAQLRDRLAGSGVGIRRVGDEIELIMPGDITFQVDRADVEPRFFRVLTDVALVLNEFEKSYIEVSGHTDSTGSDSYNQELSERRAGAVAEFLISQQVMAERLIVRGYGELRPIATNDTQSGRAQNRRVELRIVPLTR